MKKIPHARPDMIVADVVALFAEASDVLMSYGLHCVGCHANAFETLEQGIMGHGYPQEHLNDMIAELNEYIDDINEGGGDPKTLPPAADNFSISLTDAAIEHIQSIAKNEDKEGLPLKIEIQSAGGKLKYNMNFVEQKELGLTDKSFRFVDGKVIVALDKRYYKKIDGLEIDYVEEKDRAGFKMNNPNQ